MRWWNHCAPIQTHDISLIGRHRCIYFCTSRLLTSVMILSNLHKTLYSQTKASWWLWWQNHWSYSGNLTFYYSCNFRLLLDGSSVQSTKCLLWSFHRLICWLKRHVNQYTAILYQYVRESRSLRIHIYIFLLLFFSRDFFFFFLRTIPITPIKISIWFIDGILIVPINPGQSGSESNGNEGLLHIPQISWTGASP